MYIQKKDEKDRNTGRGSPIAQEMSTKKASKRCRSDRNKPSSKRINEAALVPQVARDDGLRP